MHENAHMKHNAPQLLVVLALRPYAELALDSSLPVDVSPVLLFDAAYATRHVTLHLMLDLLAALAVATIAVDQTTNTY